MRYGWEVAIRIGFYGGFFEDSGSQSNVIFLFVISNLIFSFWRMLGIIFFSSRNFTASLLRLSRFGQTWRGIPGTNANFASHHSDLSLPKNLQSSITRSFSITPADVENWPDCTPRSTQLKESMHGMQKSRAATVSLSKLLQLTLSLMSHGNPIMLGEIKLICTYEIFFQNLKKCNN